MQPFKYQPPINSGQFRNRISIYGPTISKDELHQEVETFGEVAKAWAMIKTTQGREIMEPANAAEYSTRFVIRFSASLNELFKADSTRLEIHYDGMIYDVESIINDDEADKTFTIVSKGRA
ncbi:Phage head-tail joining protein [Planococcus massiliensis]|uniref:Phage head-tail joining protein n=1 Tax=Planococcus massiliensis TaxID=1499687 RepID=A0A098ELD7_9BACL|nr:phage head closure protein [Planococcus massiliensis]CEG23129.1 Phage head-tail joining protein [Planococcus massiliensis]